MVAILRTLILSVATILFFAFKLSASPKITVPGLPGKSCITYLHTPVDAPNLPLMISLDGTGIYTTATPNKLEAAWAHFYKKSALRILTIDKPGISMGDTDDDLFINNDIYEQYVQTDLVTCLINAIKSTEISPYLHSSSDIYISGHSEGAQVGSRFYRYLMENEPSLAGRVRMLILSGLPLGNWRDMLNSQLNENARKRFWSAYQLQNNLILRTFGHLTFAYLRDIFNQEPLQKTFEALRQRGTKAEFQVFQGLRDKNTTAQAVMDYDAQNRAQLIQGLPALKFITHYYDAGHQLNRNAISDIIKLLSERLKHSSSSGEE